MSGMQRRPRVAVLYREDVPGERLEAYVEALAAAGTDAVTCSPDDAPTLSEALTEYDGVVLTGGVDIDPAIYGETPHEKVRHWDAVRDGYELRTLRSALERDLPVLGICRGHQLLNVAFGGALLQHIEGDPHRAQRSGESRWHGVRLAPASRLAAIYGAAQLRVNSRHHQGVTPDGLASGLTVAATADDGMIEGLEAADRRFVVSVQWHPEREELGDGSAPLFRAFVQAMEEKTI